MDGRRAVFGPPVVVSVRVSFTLPAMAVPVLRRLMQLIDVDRQSITAGEVPMWNGTAFVGRDFGAPAAIDGGAADSTFGLDVIDGGDA